MPLAHACGFILLSQIAADSTVTARRNERRKMAVRKADQEMTARAAEAGEDIVPARLSRKILDVARAQQAEVAAAQDAVTEAGRLARAAGGSGRAGAAAGHAAFGAASAAVAGTSAASRALAGSSLAAGTRMVAPEDLDDDEEDFDEEDEDGVPRGGDAEAAFAIGGDAGELTLDPAGEYVVHSGSREDVDLFNRLLAAQAPAGAGSSGGAPGQSISDLVGEKMREAERAAARARGGARSVGGASALAELGFSDRVIKVFSDVAAVLSRYRAGKLPKVMKILPGMAGWEDLLGLTGPDAWTPHAFYAITRVFASNLNDVRAQRFFNLYLLPAVRNDIQTNHKLNYHLYQALRKALYKPAAWYKGILLPLAASGDCTLREATIVASVLTTRRVPPLQSAAAVYKLATMRYSPAISVFLRMLLSKKYALPFRVVDAVADHFAGFASLPGPLPVLWHQAFLAFATHYSASTTQEQRERLKHTITAQVHRGITLEVRRELFSTPARDGQGGKLDARKDDANHSAPAHIPGAARTMVVSAGADEDLDM